MDRGKRLKTLREKKSLSQTDASRFLGISKQTLYKYENDIITNIPSDIIERIAKLYDTTPSYIMGWEDTDTLKEELTQAYINNDKLKALSEAYDRADDRTKALVDMALGIIPPDAVLPHSPTDNS